MAPSSILLQGGTVLFHDEADNVISLEDTDILVEGQIIKKIGKNLDTARSVSGDVEVIDCQGKIISPGFVDTHHHLWQTQLKGRHADHTLMDYLPSGLLQGYSYRPDDVFLGQLGGCLEAIDAGTTFVLDHSHATYSQDHASQALRATTTSGIRSVFAYAIPMRLTKWDESTCVADEDLMPDWACKQVQELASQQPFGDGRVHIGFGFDALFLPKDMVIGVYERFRKAGVKIITSHVGKNVLQGDAPIPRMLSEYGLLGPDLVLSHCLGYDDAQYKLLSDAGVYISSTPETESQMAMGWPKALDPGVKGSLGIDCHSCNTSSILNQARTLLLMARQQTNQPLIQTGKYPLNLRGSTAQAFNLATIEGARAVGMAESIGSIAEGKFADLVVFDAAHSPGMICAQDPLVAVLRHSDIRDIDTVIINGVVKKRHGRLLPVGGDMPWDGFAKALLASRREIQERIDRVDQGVARELMMRAWYIDGGKFEKVD